MFNRFCSQLSRKFRNGNRLGGGPAVSYALLHRAPSEPESLSPLSSRKCLSIVLNKYAGAFVVGVCNSVNPPAVVSRIMPIVVDSVDLMFGCGSRPHVVVKSNKRVSPLVAYFNPTRTISMVPAGVRVEATGLHGSPDVKLGRMRKAVGLPELISRTMVLFHQNLVSIKLPCFTN